MVRETIQVNYEVLETVQARFTHCSESLGTCLSRLDAQVETLRSGWVGRGADAFFAEWEGDVRPRLQRLVDAQEESVVAVRKIVAVMSAAEDDAAAVFRNGDGGGAGRSGGSGGVDAYANIVNPIGIVDLTDAQRDALLSGAMGAGFATMLGNGSYHAYATSTGKPNGALFGASGRAGAGAYLASSEVSGKYGSASAKFGEVKAEAEGSIAVNEDGFKMEGKAEASATLIQSEANAKIAGVDVAIESRIAAEYEAKGDVVIDPKTGNMYVEAEVGAFAGASVESSAEYDFGFGKVGVRGELQAGVGATANGFFGIQDGVLRIDGQASAALKAGGGAGVYVELDLNEIGDSVVEWSEDAANSIDETIDDGVDYISDQLAATTRFLGGFM